MSWNFCGSDPTGFPPARHRPFSRYRPFRGGLGVTGFPAPFKKWPSVDGLEPGPAHRPSISRVDTVVLPGCTTNGESNSRNAADALRVYMREMAASRRFRPESSARSGGADDGHGPGVAMGDDDPAGPESRMGAAGSGDGNPLDGRPS